MKKIVVLFLLSAIALGGCNSLSSKKDKKDANPPNPVTYFIAAR